MEEARAQCPACGAEYPAGARFCPGCGHVFADVNTVAATSDQQPPATPQSTVVYVQPTAPPRESSWGVWIALLALVVVVGGGLALWSSGLLAAEEDGMTNTPTSVTIDNSPQMTTEQQADAEAPAPDAPVEPAPQEPAVVPDSPPAIDIISVEGKVLEKYATEWRYGYTVRLRNNTANAVTTNIRVQFMDEQGYPVDDDVMNNLVIPANTELTFDGEDLISTELVERIRSLLADQR